MDVSVIIPTYNRLWCLPKAIESCRNTKCRTEIIVVDDGSTDGTAAWLAEQKDLIVVRQENWGKCWAVNSAFKLSKGKYVRFLDSDDMLAAGSIDAQFSQAEGEGLDMVVSGYVIIDKGDQILRIQPWIECDDFIAQQLGECDSSHYSAYLFKKSFLEDIPHRPDFAFRDDRLVVIEAAIKEPVVGVYPQPALHHRSHPEDRLQLNSNLKQSVQNYQHLQIYRKMLSKLQKDGKLTERRLAASTKILWPLIHWIAKDNIAEAKAALIWLKSIYPNFKITENGLSGLLYRTLGFTATQKILKTRRIIKYRWR